MKRIIPHIDDIGVTVGSVEAMERLAGAGFITSGSMMVPAPWAADVAALAKRRPELDLGVHLTLTSESARLRWRPLSTTSPASGLIDGDGFMWSTVPQLRAHAALDAVEGELRAQIDAARALGVDVTHLDHHMGASLAPEFAETTLQVAEDVELPLLYPANPGAYAAVLNWGDDADLSVLEQLRPRVTTPLFDAFLMGLTFRDEDPDTVYRRFVDTAGPLSFFSMHCNAPGEVTAVHPGSAAWRIAEYELAADPQFIAWLQGQPVELIDFRQL